MGDGVTDCHAVSVHPHNDRIDLAVRSPVGGLIVGEEMRHVAKFDKLSLLRAIS